ARRPPTAEDKSPWIGQKVVTKYRTSLGVGDRVVYDGNVFRVYRVEHVDGDWLWLTAGDVSGWVGSGEGVSSDRAVDFYTQQIRANPRSARDYVCRGLIRAERGEAEAALADYGEAIRLDPTSADAFACRGCIRYARKDYDRAVAEYTEAI